MSGQRLMGGVRKIVEGQRIEPEDDRVAPRTELDALEQNSAQHVLPLAIHFGHPARIVGRGGRDPA